MKMLARFLVLCFVLSWMLSPSLHAHDDSSDQLHPLEGKDYERLVRDSRGNVTLVNFWATWCPPCVREFPALLRLREEFAGQGLRLVLVSANNSDDRASVARFLARHGVRFRTFLKKSTDDGAFVSAIDKSWSGALPASFLYDRQGRLVKTVVGGRTYEELERLVRPLFEDGSRVRKRGD